MPGKNSALQSLLRVQYATTDPGLGMALHQWFAAPLSDHEHHAVGH